MITYEKICKRPKAALSLIGMSLSEFDELYAEFEIVHAERIAGLQVTKRKGKLRQRATGYDDRRITVLHPVAVGIREVDHDECIGAGFDS